MAPNWGSMVSISGNYICFEGFEIANSAGMGVAISGSHNEVHHLNVNHCAENGILAVRNASYNLIEGSKVWWNCKNNAYGKSRRGWASGLSSARHPVNNTIIRKNTVFNNWGEGLSTYESDQTIIEDNVVYDNYSCNIYISDASHVLCQRNFIYNTPASIVTSGARIGIQMGDEKYNPPSSDIIVINNIVTGTRKNLYWWKAGPAEPMKNVLIANNTFVNSTYQYGIQITPGQIQNVRFINNLIEQDDLLPVALVISAPGFTLSNNLWSKTPPSNAAGEGDIIGDPELIKTGDQLSPGWYKLMNNSPAINKALTLSEVTQDFSGDSRAVSRSNPAPDIGADEYVNGRKK